MMVAVVDTPEPKRETGRPVSSRRLRVDAERNRLAVLDSARSVFAEQGVTASLEEIARRAGVGIGTLYRHFPRGREQLFAEALVDQVSRYVVLAEQALQASDPWAGFAGFVERICEMEADDRGLSDLLAMALPADERVEELRAQANDLMLGLVQQAKASGQLRADFVGEDLVLLLIANTAIIDATSADAPGASRRMVGLFLEAVRARKPASDLPEAPSSEKLRRAMVRLAQTRGCAVPAHRSAPTLSR
jgi:AcrR family transcriptional regulator